MILNLLFTWELTSITVFDHFKQLKSSQCEDLLIVTIDLLIVTRDYEMVRVRTGREHWSCDWNRLSTLMLTTPTFNHQHICFGSSRYFGSYNRLDHKFSGKHDPESCSGLVPSWDRVWLIVYISEDLSEAGQSLQSCISSLAGRNKAVLFCQGWQVHCVHWTVAWEVLPTATRAHIWQGDSSTTAALRPGWKKHNEHK